MRRRSNTHPVGHPKPKNGKRLKSSVEARRLCQAALRRHKTQHSAARALGLPNQAQFRKILNGEIKDTPAMKAALVRAETRAKRAYYLVPAEPRAETVNVEAVVSIVHKVVLQLQTLEAILRTEPSNVCDTLSSL